jgi:hypothetical protein
MGQVETRGVGAYKMNLDDKNKIKGSYGLYYKI